MYKFNGEIFLRMKTIKKNRVCVSFPSFFRSLTFLTVNRMGLSTQLHWSCVSFEHHYQAGQRRGGQQAPLWLLVLVGSYKNTQLKVTARDVGFDKMHAMVKNKRERESE